MQSCSSLVGRSFCLAVLAAATAVAQNPTFSLEVITINARPLKKPASQITAAPGDTLTTEIYLRDWSPAGEPLRALQATLDPNGYTSGLAGSIKPVDFELTSAQGLSNPDNCFVESGDPRFVHAGVNTIPIADSVAYRWVSVLLDSGESPLCDQSGRKFYVGTLRLQVSEDAQGQFQVRLDEEPSSSGLRDPENKPIMPVDFERLTIDVVGGAGVLRIRSSDPPNNAIDARRRVSRTEGVTSIPNTVTFIFSGDTTNLEPLNFDVQDGTDNPPFVKSLTTDGASVTLVLDRHFAVGAWTTIIHKDSQTFAQIGYLPGDVDNDGDIKVGDFVTLIGELNDGGQLPLFRTDIDRDGRLDVADVLQLIDLLTAPEVFRTHLPG